MRSLLANRFVLALGALVVAIALLAVATTDRTRGGGYRPPLSVHSTDSDGARAYYLWLDALGYRVEALEFSPFRLDPRDDVLMVLAPTSNFSEGDVEEVVRWVEGGGVLVVATVEQTELLPALDAGLRSRGRIVNQAAPVQPVFVDPPVSSVDPNSGYRLEMRDPVWTPILASADDRTNVIAATRTLGAGRVILIAGEYPFSNDGIVQADNAAFVLGVLAGLPRGSTVVFDEYHHGYTEHGTLMARLVREPWGWAILAGMAIIFTWLVLAGRRFGRAVPPLAEGAPRSSGEYVATLGGLLRRGRHADWLREHYVGQVKRALGARYRIPPDFPARLFVEVLAARRPDAADLGAPLEQLESAARLDESMTISLMRDIDAIQRRLLGQSLAPPPRR